MATASSSSTTSAVEWDTLKVCSFVGASLGNYSGTDAFRSASKRVTKQHLQYHRSTATTPATRGAKQQNTRTNTLVIEEFKQATLQLWEVIGGLDGSIPANNWKIPPPTTLLYNMASSKLNAVFMLVVDRMIIDDIILSDSSVSTTTTTTTSTAEVAAGRQRLLRIPLIVNSRLVALMAHPGVPPAIQLWACNALAKLMCKTTAMLVSDCSPSEVDATKEATRLLGYGIVNAAGAWVSGGHAPAILGQLLVLLGATQLSINAWPVTGGGCPQTASSVLRGLLLTVLGELHQIVRDHKCLNQVADVFWRTLDAVSAARWEAPYKAVVGAFVRDNEDDSGVVRAPPHGSYDSEDGAAYVSALTTQVYQELYMVPLIAVLCTHLEGGSNNNNNGAERSLLKEMVESRWKGCLTPDNNATTTNKSSSPTTTTTTTSIKDINGGAYRRSMIQDAPSVETPTPTVDHIRTAVSHLQFQSSIAPQLPEIPTDSNIVFTCWKEVLFDRITQQQQPNNGGGGSSSNNLIVAAIAAMQHVPEDACSALDATILGLITAIKIESEKPQASGDDFDFSDDFGGSGDSGVSQEALIPHNPWYSDSASAVLSDAESRRCNALSCAFKVGASMHNTCCQLLDGTATSRHGGGGVGAALALSTPPTTSSVNDEGVVFGLLYPISELRSLLDNATAIAPSQDRMSSLVLGICLQCQVFIEAPPSIKNNNDISQHHYHHTLQQIATGMQALMMGVCLLQQGNASTKGGDVCAQGALLAIFGTQALLLRQGHTTSTTTTTSNLGGGIDGNGVLLVITALTTLINRSNQFNTMDITHFYIPALNTLCWALGRLSPSPTSAKSQVAVGAVSALIGDSPVGASLLHRWWSTRVANNTRSSTGGGAGSDDEWGIAKHLRQLLTDGQWNSYLADIRGRSPLSGWWLLSEVDQHQGRIAEAADTDDLFITDTTPTRILQQQQQDGNHTTTTTTTTSSAADQLDVSYSLSQLLELNRSPSISSRR